MSSAVCRIVLILICVSSFAYGRGGDATKMIKKGESAMRGASTQALMSMKVVRPDFVRTLEIRTWAKGKSKALVEILSPRKERGIASLRVQDQMWNYLPKMDRVARVPSSMMLQSWMGSDFTNDDLVKSSSLVRDYNHKILKYQGKGRNKQALIECSPKKNAAVVWGKVLYWARVSDSLPVKQVFYDDRGKKVRSVWFTKFRKMDDRIIPTRITIQGNMKGKTVVEYKKVLFDRQLSNQLFDRNRLKMTTEQGLNMSKGWITQRVGADRDVYAAK